MSGSGPGVEPHSVTAVVLCGGESRRFGRDKIAADLRGRTVLDRLLSLLPTEWDIVCVGPERVTTRQVQWTREDPVGGGPLAGVMAGIAAVASEAAVVLAGDMPLAGSAASHLADELARHPDTDAVLAEDGSGHINPLLAAYRVDAVRALVAGTGHDRPAKVLRELPHRVVSVGEWDGRDIDTPTDLDAVAAEVARREHQERRP